MTSSEPPEAVRIAVFAKAPVPGQVKTRLADTLGDAGAARFHGTLVKRALASARAARVGPVELHCAPDADHAFFAECAAEFGVMLRAQRGPDLGARMAHAFARSLEAGAPLVVIGSDCPALAPADLRAAATALGTHDAVLIPAEDGGYVLIGLARPVEGLFEGIAWGSDAVLAQTRDRLRRAAARVLELPTLWDVDRPEDYERLRRARLLANP